MITFRTSHTVISSFIYLSISLCVSSSYVAVNTNQQDDGGKVQSSLLGLHLEIQSSSSLSNIKSTIRDEIKTILNEYQRGINKSLDDENVEERSPIAECSTHDQTNKLDTKLDKLNSQFQTIEKLLQDLQKNNNRTDTNKENCCLKEQNSLGVLYSTCTKTEEKPSHYPKNCKEVLQSGKKTTGIYVIYPTHAKVPFPVLCDMDTKGGGWTHIQKRFDGSQYFDLEWRHYKFGFGVLEGEFWLGLQNIYYLTDAGPSELLVEIVDRDNVSAHAHYTSFGIGPEKNGYTLDRLSGFSGDAGDSLTHHLGQKFSAKDLDFTKDNCATLYPGGWWFKACHISHLNGQFINVDLPAKLIYKGLHWKTFRSHDYCHAKSRMLVRPAS